MSSLTATSEPTTTSLRPAGTAGAMVTMVQIAGRTRKQLQRSPQVLGIAVASACCSC
jgi:hypothetical protein